MIAVGNRSEMALTWSVWIAVLVGLASSEVSDEQCSRMKTNLENLRADIHSLCGMLKNHRRQMSNETVSLFSQGQHILSDLHVQADYGRPAGIIFLPVVSYGRPMYFHAVVCCSSSSFFPRLISAAADWMSAILPHMVWP